MSKKVIITLILIHVCVYVMTFTTQSTSGESTEAATSTETSTTIETSITTEAWIPTEPPTTIEASITTETPTTTEAPTTTETHNTSEASTTTETPTTSEASTTTETPTTTEASITTETPTTTASPSTTEALTTTEATTTTNVHTTFAATTTEEHFTIYNNTATDAPVPSEDATPTKSFSTTTIITRPCESSTLATESKCAVPSSYIGALAVGWTFAAVELVIIIALVAVLIRYRRAAKHKEAMTEANMKNPNYDTLVHGPYDGDLLEDTKHTYSSVSDVNITMAAM
ncbi:uncharacterized protein LOC127852136 [Dreissena polymorpha]|uniref:uncharacterized protein LOC127852136 n=1 Tax=Dreissena polymorpha TaxID=45954 RepID=UPI0022656B67|nr:uncharacterized protein LOC127852136 [Dreissena polymorpha]